MLIAVDAMGGDAGPAATVAGSLLALAEDSRLRITLFGDEARLTPFLNSTEAQQLLSRDRLALRHCSQIIQGDDRPSRALRDKPDASMARAIEAHAAGEFDGCVSAGNTGALLGLGCFWLETFPGIDRPALCTAAPTVDGHVWLLDMGANLECSDLHLYQFALMGHQLARLVDGNDRPRIALLNIGSEAGKGPAVIRNAADRLQFDDQLNFTGYVEGDGIFSGAVDVVVCDGFVGNLVLKSSEGVARTFASALDSELRKSWHSRIGAWLCLPVLRRFSARIDPGRYNGAPLLGLRGVVVKSHGGANAQEFACAIKVAATQVATNLAAGLAEVFGGIQT